VGGLDRAEARKCIDDTLETVSNNGDILIMMSGSVYQVLPGDDIDSALWLPSADVLICEAPLLVRGRYVMIYDIINTEEQGEKVGAERIR
jgi:hypothetical protein